jgi:ABC-type Zn uptake system ZnuABC Zn-binding protein ZnuA
MKKNNLNNVAYILLFALFLTMPAHAARVLKVVTTLPDYADLAGKIGKEKIEVKAIVGGAQDAHFIRPRPSFVSMLREADVLIATGLDLEMWLPSAVDKSSNRRIRSGAPGYISVATGLKLKEKPVNMSRIDGGLHIYGNPHITVSPLNILHVINNIKIGLSRNMPEAEDFFAENAEKLTKRICKRLYGEKLGQILGYETLVMLHRSNQLFTFLESKKFQKKSLSNYAGGWLKQMLPFKDKKIVTYHKNWRYFIDTFSLHAAGFIEPKPGIPPSPRHLKELEQSIKKQNIKLIIAANYFDEKTVKQVARKTGASYLMLPYYVGGKPGIETWEDLFDHWVGSISGVLAKVNRN